MLFSVSAFAYEITVDDNANLFTTDEYEMIFTSADEFASSTDISLAVLTIDTAQGFTSEEYANDCHDYLIDSEGWSEDSMLILIDMDNRNVWISTTGRASDIYYDVDAVIDGGYDALTYGEYGKSVVAMIDTAMYYYNCDGSSYDDYITGDSYIVDYEQYDYENGASGTVDAGDILIYIIVGLGIGGISVFTVKNRYKNFGKGDEFSSDNVILDLTGSNDTVISRNVVTTKVPRNNNHHHNGGSSGGRSHHSSGGGRSHGGGGRSF